MKRFYRSRHNKIIAGVCGGLGEYFQIDPLLVRILWIASLALGTVGPSIYCVAWVIVPGERREGEFRKKPGSSRFTLGVVLIAAGLLGIIESLWLLSGRSLFSILGMIPGLMLTASGLVLVIMSLFSAGTKPDPFRMDGEAQPDALQAPRSERKLLRSRRFRQLSGICGGAGVYFDADPVLIRLIFLSGLFVSGGIIVLIYVILIFVIPEEPVFESAHHGV